VVARRLQFSRDRQIAFHLQWWLSLHSVVLLFIAPCFSSAVIAACFSADSKYGQFLFPDPLARPNFPHVKPPPGGGRDPFIAILLGTIVGGNRRPKPAATPPSIFALPDDSCCSPAFLAGGPRACSIPRTGASRADSQRAKTAPGLDDRLVNFPARRPRLWWAPLVTQFCSGCRSRLAMLMPPLGEERLGREERW